MVMRESEWIKEYFMLDFNFELNHKYMCVIGMIILLKWGVMLASVWFIVFLDLNIKIWEPNWTISV